MPDHPASSSDRTGRAAALAVGVAVALGYAGLTAGHGFLYDDRQLVLEEARPSSAAGIARAFVEGHYGALPYYRPLTRATYLAQKAWHGDAPGPYHALNAALAGALALAACALLRAPRFGIAPGAAVLGSALFLAHPAVASCVFPIAGRDTLLPAVLMVGAVALWLRTARAGAWTLCALALLAKEVAIATPLLFVWADATAEDRPRGARAWAARHAPGIAVVLSYLVARSAVLAEGTPVAWSGWALGPIASLAYGLQAGFAPFARLVYEPPVSVWLSVPRLGAALLAAGGLAAWLGRARPGASRTLAFWAGWFVLAQLPSANFVRQESAFDERYVALGLLGPIAIGAAALSASGRRRRLAAIAGMALVAAAAVMTVGRADDFQTELAFQTAWVRSNPSSANGHNGLGVALRAAGRADEAEREYRAALAAVPDHEQAANNLGVLLLERGQTAAAAALLETAVASSPRYAAARYNLAGARARQGRAAEAEALYREAIRLRPDYAAAWNNLGALLLASGRAGEALAAFDAAVRIDPAHARARVNRGIALARQGRLDEAIASYREALALDPADPDAWFDLGGASAAKGDLATARAAFERALALRPGWSAAAEALAAARRQSNNEGGGSSVNERR